MRHSPTLKPYAAMRASLALLFGLLIGAQAAVAQEPAQTRVEVSGLQAPAEILIDRWGVPHMYAASQQDAFFLQGWNAARDRLWQIDLWRRNGLGRLAEVLGPDFVAKDRAARLFLFRGNLRREWSAYGREAEQRARAFVTGVNAYVTATRSNPDLLPQEFQLAGYQPELWEVDDLIRIRTDAIVFSAILQAGRAQAACADGSTDQVLPAISPAWRPRIPEGLDFCDIPSNVLEQYMLSRSQPAFAPRQSANSGANTSVVELIQPEVINRGSNNWVIGPSRSATGRPILANDPHVAVTVPSQEYIAHISAPGLDVIGAWYPSTPGILLGHNGNAAFGVTLWAIAQEDILAYETNPANSNQYRYRGRWESIRTVRESIAVRGAAAEEVTLRFTRHGPILQEDSGNHRAFAIRASWLEAGGAPWIGTLRYLDARTVNEAEGAFDHWRGVGLNFVVADTNGDIGWFPSGAVPRRPNTDGIFPVPGDGRYEWRGYLNSDVFPSEINPDRGYIATANQMNLPRGYPYERNPISFFWLDHARFDRITEVLDALPRSTVQDSQRLQTDYVTIPGRRLARLSGTITTTDPELAEASRWLSTWDGNATADSAQAALYEVWLSRHLTPAVLQRVAPSLDPINRRIASKVHSSVIVDIVENADAAHFGADPIRARDDLLRTTLASALAETRTLLGSDRSTWEWGRLANAYVEHRLSPLASDAQRAAMNVGPAGHGGDSSTVNVQEYHDANFRTSGAGSIRMVLDVGAWDNSVAINTPGQSGAWTSPHYQDLFPIWNAGEYFPLLYTRAAVERETEHRIVLTPSAR